MRCPPWRVHAGGFKIGSAQPGHGYGSHGLYLPPPQRSPLGHWWPVVLTVIALADSASVCIGSGLVQWKQQLLPNGIR